MKINDLTGRRYGRLLVVARAENDKYGRTQWICDCVCGTTKVVSSTDFKKTSSCGCYRRERTAERNKERWL